MSIEIDNNGNAYTVIPRDDDEVSYLKMIGKWDDYAKGLDGWSRLELVNIYKAMVITNE